MCTGEESSSLFSCLLIPNSVPHTILFVPSQPTTLSSIFYITSIFSRYETNTILIQIILTKFNSPYIHINSLRTPILYDLQQTVGKAWKKDSQTLIIMKELARQKINDSIFFTKNVHHLHTITPGPIQSQPLDLYSCINSYLSTTFLN